MKKLMLISASVLALSATAATAAIDFDSRSGYAAHAAHGARVLTWQGHSYVHAHGKYYYPVPSNTSHNYVVADIDGIRWGTSHLAPSHFYSHSGDLHGVLLHVHSADRALAQEFFLGGATSERFGHYPTRP